ncbi:unnamed protein product [Ostreobium quekettii]|uniref:Rhodanese domain-containing protein n=1 Tax=Ostreobium quekettii TaxID=121088 RepID=A0A8S1JIL2_9CHLO|nr:unnamed protein product [Ostreobium quekettii]
MVCWHRTACFIGGINKGCQNYWAYVQLPAVLSSGLAASLPEWVLVQGQFAAFRIGKVHKHSHVALIKGAVFDRSLIAAHELVANGFKNVRILRNGIAEYEESERLEGGPLCSGCCTIVSSEQFPHVSGEDTATIPAYFQADISFHHLTCPPLTNNSFVYMHCTCNHLPPRVSITSVFWRHTPHHRPFH